MSQSWKRWWVPSIASWWSREHKQNQAPAVFQRKTIVRGCQKRRTFTENLYSSARCCHRNCSTSCTLDFSKDAIKVLYVQSSPEIIPISFISSTTCLTFSSDKAGLPSQNIQPITTRKFAKTYRIRPTWNFCLKQLSRKTCWPKKQAASEKKVSHIIKRLS